MNLIRITLGCVDNQVVMAGCCSLTAAASNPEMVDMLPHVRGQGVMDLEFESDGGCAVFVPLPHYSSCLPSFLFSYNLLSSLPPFLSFCLEPVSTPPAHRHEVTYVTTHKGPSLAAIFSRDGTSQFQRFLKLQVSVHVHFSLLRSTCCYRLC